MNQITKRDVNGMVARLNRTTEMKFEYNEDCGYQLQYPTLHKTGQHLATCKADGQPYCMSLVGPHYSTKSEFYYALLGMCAVLDAMSVENKDVAHYQTVESAE